jgi:hypothetical protein
VKSHILLILWPKLTACKVANWYNSDTLTASPSQINFLIFVPVWSFITIAYLEITPVYAKRGKRHDFQATYQNHTDPRTLYSIPSLCTLCSRDYYHDFLLRWLRRPRSLPVKTPLLPRHGLRIRSCGCYFLIYQLRNLGFDDDIIGYGDLQGGFQGCASTECETCSDK